MNRRNFLAGSLGATTALLMNKRALAAKPCPPIGFGDPNSPYSCGIGSETGSLSEAANALGTGQFTTFTGPPTAIGRYGISWQHVSAYWDAFRNEFHFMAKAQGGGSASHWIYSESDGVWRATTRNLVPGQAGHIWNVSFDHDRGDYYYFDFPHTNYVRRMDRGIEAGQGGANSPWKMTSSPGYDMRSQNGEGAIGFHPNLYGQGDGGLIVWCGTKLQAWRRRTNTWDLMHSFGSGPYWGNQRGGSVYVPGLDVLMLGTGIRHQNFMAVSAGSNGSLSSMQPPLRSAPIPQEGSINNALPWGKTVIHPADRTRVLLLEAGPKRSGLRVWATRDGGQSWSIESYTHPFHNLPWTDNDAGHWTVGSVPSYDILWGMAYDGNRSESILWKPPA